VEEFQDGFLWLAKKTYSAEETEARNRRFKSIHKSSPLARRGTYRA